MQKKLILKNSLTDGQVFYGLHMSEGIATYKPQGKDPFTVFVGESAIKLMNSTFPGKPVYVGHTDDRGPLDQADGVVSDSFYNPVDGKHWCKFVVTTQKGLDAINRGWKLSNAFSVDEHTSGGEWHGAAFSKEVVRGSYDHLAIVPDPRYSESLVLTSAQWKEYNNNKKAELLRLENSKESDTMKLQFWKKEVLKNEKDMDLENMSVTLPKSKKEKTILQLVNEADEAAIAVAPSIEDAKVTVNGVEMTVKELVKMYVELKKLDEEEESTEEVLENEDDSDDDDTLQNSNDGDEDELEGGELPEVDTDEMEEPEAPAKEVVKNSKKTLTPEEKAKNLKKLRLANSTGKASSQGRVALSSTDMVARGAARYGSK